MASPSSRHFDLIVVGAGVLGTFHALFAARKGLRVLLTEKDQYPRNATVRNFGQVVPSGMPSDWFEYGRRSTEIYKELQNEFDLSVRKNGSVYVASDQEEVQLIHELKQIMDRKGYDAQLLTVAQCAKKWPAIQGSYCKEALFFPEEISVEPEKMIYKVIEYATQKFPNLAYRPHCTVIDCNVEGTVAKVVTSTKETLTAGKVVICNGGEFKLLFAELFRTSGIVMSKLQMLKTMPMPSIGLEGNILTGLTIRRYESFEECPSFSSLTIPDHLAELKKWGIHILFKKATDGSFIIGDSHEYADVMHTDDLGFITNHYINELMLTEAQRIVCFDIRNITSSWSGFYPQHKTKGIVEIDIENIIHIRTAIGGKGMTSAPSYAEVSIQKIFTLS